MATKQFAWEEYYCLMGGKRVSGIRGFKVGVSRVKELIYGEGSDPQSVGRGNRTPNCEVTMLKSELDALILSAGGDPTDMEPIDLVHAYVPKKGAQMVMRVVKDWEPISWEDAMKQGDTHNEITVPGICLKVIPNAFGLPNASKPSFS